MLATTSSPAHHPWKQKKALFSMAVTDFAGNRAQKRRGRRKLLFLGVRRAYFYAAVQRPIYVRPPVEAGCPEGYCARLNVSMYGTRDAASNWESTYSSHLKSHGFIQGRSTPCAFHHPTRDITLVVHGDDFSFLGYDPDLDWCKQIMESAYEIKDRGRLGPDSTDSKHIRILNRCLEWRRDGLFYEADPRHSEIIVTELGLSSANAVATPSVKSNSPDDSTPLNAADS